MDNLAIARDYIVRCHESGRDDWEWNITEALANLLYHLETQAALKTALTPSPSEAVQPEPASPGGDPECAPLSHSWELWNQDMRRWPIFCELRCTICGKQQLYVTIHGPSPFTPDPKEAS